MCIMGHHLLYTSYAPETVPTHTTTFAILTHTTAYHCVIEKKIMHLAALTALLHSSTHTGHKYELHICSVKLLIKSLIKREVLWRWYTASLNQRGVNFTNEHQNSNVMRDVNTLGSVKPTSSRSRLRLLHCHETMIKMCSTSHIWMVCLPHGLLVLLLQQNSNCGIICIYVHRKL